MPSNHTQHYTARLLNGYERSGSGDGDEYGHGGVHIGGRPSCVARLSPVAAYLLQHSSAVNCRPVPHKACLPVSSKTPDAAWASMSKHLQISALFCGSRNLFWAREPRGSCIRPSQKPSSNAMAAYGKVQVWLWRSNKPPLPAGRELTAGSLGNSRKGSHTAGGPWIFPPTSHLALSGPTAQKGKYSRRNLSGPPGGLAMFDARARIIHH